MPDSNQDPCHEDGREHRPGDVHHAEDGEDVEDGGSDVEQNNRLCHGWNERRGRRTPSNVEDGDAQTARTNSHPNPGAGLK